MRVRALLLLLFLSLCVVAAGQQREQEDAYYRRTLLNESGAKTITDSKQAIPVTKASLKIFILAPEQAKLESNFAEWLAEWNKSEGVRFGQVEIAPDAARADIILARFISPDIKEKATGDEGISRNEIPLYPGTTQQLPIYKPPATARFYTKVYFYIVVKQSDGLKVLSNWTDSLQIVGSDKLGDESYKNLKTVKDSKRVGDKFRDRFFEMMKSTARTLG
jgi:hypothetical protein